MRRRKRKNNKKKIFNIFLVIIIILIILIIIIKPGNILTKDINIGNSKNYSKFELGKVTINSLFEFLKMNGKLNSITYNEKKSSHEKEEWARIYNVDKNKVIVLYIDYNDYKNNKNYKPHWVYVKEKNGWVLRSKIK